MKASNVANVQTARLSTEKETVYFVFLDLKMPKNLRQKPRFFGGGSGGRSEGLGGILRKTVSVTIRGHAGR